MLGRPHYLRALFVIAALALPPASVRATTLAAITRGAGAGSDKAAALAGYFMRYSLIEDGRYEVVDNSERLNADRAEAQEAFDAAGELVKKAVAAYETLELDPAIEYLATALQKYERNVAFITDTKKVGEALMLLGAVHILRGEERAGVDRLTQAAAILPAATPDPRIFNPSMRQVFDKASAQLGRRPRGSLSITSSPSYAEAYVDGVFRGVTPVTVEQLPPGRHYVRLARDGYRSYGAVVSVAAGKEASESGTLHPTKDLDDYDKQIAAALTTVRDALPDEDEGPDDAMEMLGAMLGIEHLFLAEVRLDAEHVNVIAAQYDLKGRKHLKTATHVFTYDGRPEVFEREVGVLLRTQFGETTLARRDLGAGAAVTATGLATLCFGIPCPKFKKIALYGGGGGGAALAGVGVVMYLLAWRDHDTYRRTPQLSDESTSLSSSGKLKALLGDVFVPLGLAVAGLGLGAYFFYEPAAASLADAGPAGSAFGVAVAPLAGGAAVVAGGSF